MAGTQFGPTVTETEISVGFETQYVSGSLNRKLMALPRGVVRGFRPVPTLNNDEVDFELDTMMLDSVINATGFSPGSTYAVTYRTLSVITLDLSAEASARYYVAFVPNYTIGSATDGEWRWYTEAQFEAGDIETDGGVFICSLISSGNVSVFDPWDVILAGQSTTTDKHFIREDVDNFKSDQGPSEKALVVDWLPTTGLTGFFGIPAGFAYDDTEVHNGAGSLAITATSSGNMADVHPVWRGGGAAQDVQATMIVQYWYRTDGGFTASGTSYVDVDFEDAVGGTTTAKSVNGIGRAPTYREIPAAVNTTWTLIRYEIKIPDGTPITASSFNLRVVSTRTAGTLYFGRIQAWIVHRPSDEPGDFTRSFSPAFHRGELFENLVLRNRTSTSTRWNVSSSSGNAPTTMSIAVEGNVDNTLVTGKGLAGVFSRLELSGDGTTDSYLRLSNADLRTDTWRGITNDVVAVREENGGAGSGVLSCNSFRSTGTAFDFQNSAGSIFSTVISVGGVSIQDSNLIIFQGNSPVGLGGSSGAHTLHEANIIKGYVSFTLDGAGGFTHRQSLGADSISVSNPNINIVLNDAMLAGDYVVTANTSDVSFGVIARGVGTLDFDLQIYNTTTGAQVDPTTVTPTIFCMWIGEQA